MQFYTEWRLSGDAYASGFGNGHTLTQSESVQNMQILSETEDITVFKGSRGHTVKCCHEKKGDVFHCYSVFENTTDTPAALELFSSFALKDLCADRMHRLTSFWSAEGKLLSQNFADLNMEPSWSKFGVRQEKFGQIGSLPVRKWFPFIVLEDTKSGTFVGAQLYCASSWQLEVFRSAEPVSLYGGLADRDFGSWFKTVMPGESFKSPKAVVAVGTSLEDVCNKLVKAQSPAISPVDQDMPVIFNEFCTTWGNPTLENLTKTAERLDGSDIRYLVIDAGWYKVPGKDWAQTIGDWIPSKELFPNGIKEATDMIRSHGLIPGLWFEMESIGIGSPEAYNNTDHQLKRDDVPVTVGTRRFWDMRDPWVQDHLSERVIRLLKDNGFGYVKIDYNETIGAGVDGAESYGEGLRSAVLGSQAFFKKMRSEIPELVIEACSSGGHRLEPSTMELVSQASFSDAHECLSIPLIAANLHRVIRPEQSQIWSVLHADADEHRINYLLTGGFLGRLCLSGEIFSMSDAQWQMALNAVRFYDKIKHVIRDGFTCLIDQTPGQDYNRPIGRQIVLRTLGDEALLIVHTFENGADPDLSDILRDYQITETFGSELDGDFRGKAFLLHK